MFHNLEHIPGYTDNVGRLLFGDMDTLVLEDVDSAVLAVEYNHNHLLQKAYEVGSVERIFLKQNKKF